MAVLTRIILIIGMLMGLTYRFSNDIFGFGTDESKLMYFVGSTAFALIGWYLVTVDIQKSFIPYIRAFLGVQIMYLISDLFCKGEIEWDWFSFDTWSLVGFVLYCVYRLTRDKFEKN